MWIGPRFGPNIVNLKSLAIPWAYQHNCTKDWPNQPNWATDWPQFLLPYCVRYNRDLELPGQSVVKLFGLAQELPRI